MNLEIEYTFEVMGQEISVILDVDYDPGRPPPPCSNPNSPLFSDPGDPPELSINSGTMILNITAPLVEATLDWLNEEHGETIQDLAAEKAEEAEEAYIVSQEEY